MTRHFGIELFVVLDVRLIMINICFRKSIKATYTSNSMLWSCTIFSDQRHWKAWAESAEKARKLVFAAVYSPHRLAARRGNVHARQWLYQAPWSINLSNWEVGQAQFLERGEGHVMEKSKEWMEGGEIEENRKWRKGGWNKERLSRLSPV